MKRSSGILLPVTSLPSDYGIGCFDREAYKFIDRLKKAGQGYWQILPMGPTGYGDSPYQSFSTFAGNPYFISLEELINKGWIEKEDCEDLEKSCDKDYVKYDVIYEKRFKILRKAYENSGIETDTGYLAFVKENGAWLLDYALFMAIKDEKDGLSYFEWEEDIRCRKPSAMENYRKRLEEDVNFYCFMQYEFSVQWQKLKGYANENGIKIIGDIPIYVAMDSADTWANPGLFQFDTDGHPIGVAGCPPDAFSATGQLWGNPIYKWEAHKESGYTWWLERIRNCFRWYDMVRIDHFRGFDEYYAIPYGDKTAEGGKWEKGPGMDLFNCFREVLGELPIIAEDLGFLTESVRTMLKDSGFPGMKVLQFAFDTREDSDYLPYRYERNSVVYTGTHDNTTTYGWWKEVAPQDREVALRYLNRESRSNKEELNKDESKGVELNREELTWDMICLGMSSVSELCIIPMQDYLVLPEEARMNTPSTLGNNWKWRMKEDAFTDELAERICRMTHLYGR